MMFSPVIRRSGAVPSWTCRACSRSQGLVVAQPKVFAAIRVQRKRQFATQVKDTKSTGKASALAGDAAALNAHTTYPPTSLGGGEGRSNGRSGPKSKRRRRLIVAGGVLAIGTVVVTISDDAKHAFTATQRSYRVLETLVLNIREYVNSPIACARLSI